MELLQGAASRSAIEDYPRTRCEAWRVPSTGDSVVLSQGGRDGLKEAPEAKASTRERAASNRAGLHREEPAPGASAYTAEQGAPEKAETHGEQRAPEKASPLGTKRKGAGKESAPSSPAVAQAESERLRKQEELRLEEIRILMVLDRQRWQQKILALIADLSTELFRLWQEVMNRRQKAMDDALSKWTKVLLGD